MFPSFSSPSSSPPNVATTKHNDNIKKHTIAFKKDFKKTFQKKKK